jgi:hypothetical protein
MENLSDSDANILQAFGRGQGIVSGQAVPFPLLVKVKFDEDLVSEAIGDENFIEMVQSWATKPARKANSEIVQKGLTRTEQEPRKTAESGGAGRSRRGRRKGIKPDF